jgi:membrane protease YdiL (CAAX protease family)
MPDEARDTDRNGEGDPPRLPNGHEPRSPESGLPGRMNNYLLLVYAGACLLMNYSIAGMFYLRGMMYLSLILPGVFSILIPLYLLSRRFSLGFVREFGLEPPAAKTALAVLAASVSCILPIEAFSGIIERMRPPDADYISFLLSIKPKDPVSFALVALGVVIAGPFTEELLFRGFVQRILARNMSGVLAVALSGALFGLSHFNIMILPGVVALGALYGYLYHATRRLWYPVLAHALFNFSSLLRLHAATEEEIVSARVALPSLPWILLSLAVCAASLAFLARMRRADRA